LADGVSDGELDSELEELALVEALEEALVEADGEASPEPDAVCEGVDAEAAAVEPGVLTGDGLLPGCEFGATSVRSMRKS
jgi:hypothetical protein